MLSEQEQIRRNSLAELYKLGINPYPQAAFPVSVLVLRAAGLERAHPTVYQARRDLP